MVVKPRAPRVMSLRDTAVPGEACQSSEPRGSLRNRDLMDTQQLRHHTTIVSAEQLRVALSGEADLAVLAELEATLAALELRCGQLIHIDAAELSFIDLPCFRLLVEFARQARRAGAVVQLDHAPRLFRVLQQSADPEDVLGLTRPTRR